MKLLTWGRVISLAGLVGLDFKFVKMFRANVVHACKNFFITLRVTTFFFPDIDLLCSLR